MLLPLGLHHAQWHLGGVDVHHTKNQELLWHANSGHHAVRAMLWQFIA
jgi:hypothetical protein